MNDRFKLPPWELPPPPPQLRRPKLVTRNGKLVWDGIPFTVALSPCDPNWRPDQTAISIVNAKPREDYGKTLVRRIVERNAAERPER